MTEPLPLLLATTNPGKIRELTSLLAPAGRRLLTPGELGVMITIDETGDTYAANAAIKATAFARAGGIPALADDSGLEVVALDGAPGVHSARMAGPGRSDADRRRLLLRMLESKPRPWRAQFCCAMVLAVTPEDLHTTHGKCAGEIIPKARGHGGFGYDPIFQVEGTDLTMAELPQAEKNQVSHRARAAAKMLEILSGPIQA